MILVTGLLHSAANLAAWQAGGVAVLVAARCLLYCTLLYCTVLCCALLYCTAGACWGPPCTRCGRRPSP